MSDGVVGDTETVLVMRLMEPHVDPSAVLLVPCLVGVSGALLQEGVADLPIDMPRLLLEDVLICEVNLPVEVLKAGSLPKEHELVVDEPILDVAELSLSTSSIISRHFFFTKCWTKASVPTGTPRPM
jgi:hypothetical protein